MTFNQKIIAAITLLAVGATAAITFVCFEPPYSANFWVAWGALSLSEIMFGAYWIRLLTLSDGVLPFSIGACGINTAYFLFTLVATLMTRIEQKYFILIEVIGFVAFVIAHLFFRMSEHHVQEIAKNEEPEQRIERAKVTWR